MGPEFVTSQSDMFALPWLNNHLVWVVNISVGVLPVDVLQNINSRHGVPLRQVKPPTWLKMFLGEDVVLNEVDSCLHGRWRGIVNTEYQI